jgi:hypothetical protein
MVPLLLVVGKSWWFLVTFPIAFLAFLMIQGMLANAFAHFAAGRITDEGQEITWPGNLFLFLIPIVLIAHLIGKI